MSDIVTQVKETYERIAPYFSRTRVNAWPEMEKYQNMLTTGSSVLDLGCGNGRLLNGITAKIDYMGVDFSNGLIDEAKKLHPKNRFVVADVLDEKFWESLPTFDVIFGVALFHHIPERKQQLYVLDQMKKHLNDSGFIYISVWNLWKKKFWGEHLKSLPLKFRNWRWVMIPFQHKTPCFYTALDMRYLGNIIKSSGLKVNDVYFSDKKRNIIAIAKR
jgi:SAM-dependent methyltransferase